ncbi:MAG: SGNH/GDSL hydrolase family protein [Flavobacteriaceae bacterium]|nr:SGNH/GDSL hydrolase family protein [Flavobacteriaceae bacterium]
MIKIFKILLINFIVLFGGLILAEKILPVISLPIYSERTINLREHSPDQNKTFKVNKTDEKINFFTNNDGFLNEDKNDIESVIIFLGGSTVENIQVKHKDRFTYKLQSKLNNFGEVKNQVLNGGVSGSNNINSLFSYLSKGIKYKPKYVFLMGTLNDVGQLSSYNSYWKLDNNQSILNSSKSKLFLFLNYIKTYWFTNIYYHLKSINIVPSKTNDTKSKSKFNDSSTLEYIRVIKLFNKISKEFNIEFIFLTEPFFNIPDQKKTIVESLNHLILKSELNVIDLESLIPKEKKYFIDDTHLNPEGNELVSNIIFENLKNLELQNENN